MGAHDLIEDSQNDPEAMMAYWVSNASPDDPLFVSTLVERYGVDMYRLAYILLETRNRVEGISSKALELTVGAFSDALSRLPGFRGAPSVRSWLLAQVVRRSRGYRWRRGWFNSSSVFDKCRDHVPDADPHAEIQELESFLKTTLDELPQIERLVYLMRDGMDLTADETAYVLHRRSADIEDKLSKCRWKMLELINAHDASVEDVNNYLPQFIASRWPAPSQTDLKAYIDLYRETRRSSFPMVSSRLSDKLRETGVIVIALLAVLLVVWYFTRGDTHVSKPLFPSEAAPTPTAMPIDEMPVRNASEAGEDEIQYSYNLEPGLSADGRWLVFTHIDHTEVVNVYMSDLLTGDVTQLDNVPIDPDEEGGSYSPSVSLDGRWVVFSSNIPNLVPGDAMQCPWSNTTINCMDIFLYDNESGAVERITMASDGAQADGHSLMPVITPDGRWVVFWSSAINLVPGVKQTCGTNSTSENCWDVYIYNRETGQMRRLQVGRGVEFNDMVRIFPLSIPGDGSRLAITIHADDHVAETLALSNQSEVYLYDWEGDVWEAVAVDENDLPGEGGSFLPAFSSDGRYLAFVSEADRLVPVDTNGVADVFVRDLVNRGTEIVSVSNQGTPGDDHSGILPGDSIMWGEKLGISADGRYVTFISKASNLAPQDREGCRASQFSICSEVYLHDRQTKTTIAAIPQPRGDGFFIFPGVSGDGKTVWYVHYHQNCPRAPYCAEIIMFDRGSGLTASPLSDDPQLVLDAPGDWRFARFLDAGGGGGVHSLAFSPDGESLAAGMSDGSIHMWHIPDGRYLNNLEAHTSPVGSLTYDPAGELFVSASHDGTVVLWSAADGALLRRLPREGGAVFDMDFYPDGNVLAIAAQRATWNWDIRDLLFGIIDYLEYPGELVRSVAVSPDGELIAHGLSDGSLWLRRGGDMDVILRVAAHDGMINSLVYSPDGNYLASGAKDGKAKLWRVYKDGRIWQIELAVVTQQNDWVNDLAISPDGRWLGVAAFRSDIQLWGIPGGDAQDHALNVDGHQPLSIAFSPDGRWLAAASSWGGVRLWEVPQP